MELLTVAYFCRACFVYIHNAQKTMCIHDRKYEKTDVDKYNGERKTVQETQLSYFHFVHLITQSLLEPSTATATYIPVSKVRDIG